MSWSMANLADVADLIRGVTYKKEEATTAPGAGYLPLLRATNIGDQLLLDGGLVYVPEARANQSQRLCRDDIVLAASSGSVAVVGKSARLTSDWQGTFGAFCSVLRAKERINAGYLALFVRSEQVRRQWSVAASGTNINNLKRQDILRTQILLPPMEEQLRIVDILEDHLSRLDAADSYIRAAGERATGLSESVLSNSEVLRRAKRVPLGELLAEPLRHGRSVPTADVGFPVLRLTSIRDGQIDIAERKIGAWSAEEAAPYLVQERDFLVARGNGSRTLVGRGGLVVERPDSVAYPDTAIRVRPDEAKLNAGFLATVWDLHEIRRQIEHAARTTAGIYKVNQADLRAVAVPVPGLDGQRSVICLAAQITESRSRLLEQLRVAAARSVSLRRSLLRAAFSGRLTGSSTDTEFVEELAGV